MKPVDPGYADGIQYQTARTIRNRYRHGESVAVLAIAYGLCEEVVERIIDARTFDGAAKVLATAPSVSNKQN